MSQEAPEAGVGRAKPGREEERKMGTRTVADVRDTGAAGSEVTTLRARLPVPLRSILLSATCLQEEVTGQRI